MVDIWPQNLYHNKLYSLRDNLVRTQESLQVEKLFKMPNFLLLLAGRPYGAARAPQPSRAPQPFDHLTLNSTKIQFLLFDIIAVQLTMTFVMIEFTKFEY